METGSSIQRFEVIPHSLGDINPICRLPFGETGNKGAMEMADR